MKHYAYKGHRTATRSASAKCTFHVTFPEKSGREASSLYRCGSGNLLPTDRRCHAAPCILDKLFESTVDSSATILTRDVPSLTWRPYFAMEDVEDVGHMGFWCVPDVEVMVARVRLDDRSARWSIISEYISMPKKMEDRLRRGVRKQR